MHTHRKHLLMPSLLVMGLAGCVTNFPPASQIKDLRVLAITSDKPEAAPGEPVHLEALIADPTGVILPPTLVWLTCFPKLIGGVDACASGDAPQIPIDFGHSFVDVTVPPECDPANPVDPCIDLLPAGDPEAQSTVLLTLVACTSTNLNDCFTCDANNNCSFGDSSKVEVALKRVIISKRDDATRNHNPILTDVLESATGSDFVSLPEATTTPLDLCKGLTLRAQADPASAETFTQIQFGAPVEITENIETSFFVNVGQVNSDRIFNGVGDGVAPGVADDDYSLIASEPDPAGDISLFFVLRDDRGGAAFTVRKISATAPCQ